MVIKAKYHSTLKVAEDSLPCSTKYSAVSLLLDGNRKSDRLIWVD